MLKFFEKFPTLQMFAAVAAAFVVIFTLKPFLILGDFIKYLSSINKRQ